MLPVAWYVLGDGTRATSLTELGDGTVAVVDYIGGEVVNHGLDSDRAGLVGELLAEGFVRRSGPALVG